MRSCWRATHQGRACAGARPGGWVPPPSVAASTPGRWPPLLSSEPPRFSLACPMQAQAAAVGNAYEQARAALAALGNAGGIPAKAPAAAAAAGTPRPSPPPPLKRPGTAAATATTCTDALATTFCADKGQLGDKFYAAVAFGCTWVFIVGAGQGWDCLLVLVRQAP